MNFPNMAGEHMDLDIIIANELREAGIGVMDYEIFRIDGGEVKTSVRGCLHNWLFIRAWGYWVCHGPGIEAAAAEELHKAHGTSVRVDGNISCPSPHEAFKGLAVGHYHVDSPEGLKALADTISSLITE